MDGLSKADREHLDLAVSRLGVIVARLDTLIQQTAILNDSVKSLEASVSAKSGERTK